MVYPRNFKEFLKFKEYSVWDFAEPILVLPIVFAAVKFFQGANTGTIILAVLAFFVYTPLIFAVFRRRRK